MPISLSCECGRALRVKEELAGKKVRCPECKAAVAVPAPEADGVEEDAASMLAAESPKPKTRPAKKDEAEESTAVSEKPTRKPRWDDEEDEDAAPKSKKRRRDADEDDADEEEADGAPKRKKKKKLDPWGAAGGKRSRESDRSSGGSGFAINGASIVTGILMMLGAVVWFVLGIILIDRIFIYPPILFVLGIVAVFKGMMGGGDSE